MPELWWAIRLTIYLPTYLSNYLSSSKDLAGINNCHPWRAANEIYSRSFGSLWIPNLSEGAQEGSSPWGIILQYGSRTALKAQQGDCSS